LEVFIHINKTKVNGCKIYPPHEYAIHKHLLLDNITQYRSSLITW